MCITIIYCSFIIYSYIYIIDDSTFSSLGHSFLVAGLFSPFYKQILGNEYQKQRLDWQNKLRNCIDILIRDIVCIC